MSANGSHFKPGCQWQPGWNADNLTMTQRGIRLNNTLELWKPQSLNFKILNLVRPREIP